MRYKAGGCFQTAAVEAELLFSQLRECAAPPGARPVLPAEHAACGGRGWRRDPCSAPAPAAKERDLSATPSASAKALPPGFKRIHLKTVQCNAITLKTTP